jgi:hypothetical protein
MVEQDPLARPAPPPVIRQGPQAAIRHILWSRRGDVRQKVKDGSVEEAEAAAGKLFADLRLLMAARASSCLSNGH